MFVRARRSGSPRHGTSPRSRMRDSSSPACRGSLPKWFAGRRVVRATPTSPPRGARPSSSSGSPSSSASCGAQPRATLHPPTIPRCAGRTASSTLRSGWANEASAWSPDADSARRACRGPPFRSPCAGPGRARPAAMIAARSPHGSPRRGGTTLDDPNQPGDRTRPPADAGTSGSPPAGDAPGSPTGTATSGAEPPGLGAQIGSTRAAVVALGKAHAGLAKAELADIADEVKRTAALAGLAFGLLIVVATLLTIGTILFVGEWLFGSLGWGVVHGALFLSGLAVAAILVALGVPGRRVVTDYAVAVVVAVLAAVLL